MNQIRRLLHYFTKTEWVLWLSSMFLIFFFFLLFDRENGITLAASLVGVTSRVLCAKGNPLGQLLIVLFSILYGIISYTCAYYGEMVTYLGMTAPMAVFALISWLRNPFNGNHAEVRVNTLKIREYFAILLLTAIITYGFDHILRAFHTANLLPSTLSVATSFIAVYLTFRRSPLFALAYAANDLVLILLWAMATISDAGYLAVMVCFVVFFANDLYGFLNWSRMQRRQQAAAVS